MTTTLLWIGGYFIGGILVAQWHGRSPQSSKLSREELVNTTIAAVLFWLPVLVVVGLYLVCGKLVKRKQVKPVRRDLH